VWETHYSIPSWIVTLITTNTLIYSLVHCIAQGCKRRRRSFLNMRNCEHITRSRSMWMPSHKRSGLGRLGSRWLTKVCVVINHDVDLSNTTVLEFCQSLAAICSYLSIQRQHQYSGWVELRGRWRTLVNTTRTLGYHQYKDVVTGCDFQSAWWGQQC